MLNFSQSELASLTLKSIKRILVGLLLVNSHYQVVSFLILSISSRVILMLINEESYKSMEYSIKLKFMFSLESGNLCYFIFNKLIL